MAYPADKFSPVPEEQRALLPLRLPAALDPVAALPAPAADPDPEPQPQPQPDKRTMPTSGGPVPR